LRRAAFDQEGIMTRILLVLALTAGIFGGGLVAAETASSTAKPAAATPAQPGSWQSGMMGAGMMGGGMLGAGMCPITMAGLGTKMDVKKIDKGVSITFTSTDPLTVARLQKMAEAMRLMHQAMMQ
jgi:predicted lipid-binding transport protein (Tim44 family)